MPRNRAPSTISLTLARRLHERRTAAGMTQAELATRSGVTVETVARIERALRSRDSANTNPSLETMYRLAGSLGATVSDLLSEGPQSRTKDPTAAFISALPKDVRRRVDAVARALAHVG